MDARPPQRLGPAGAPLAPTVDVSAMPRVLGRIARLALAYPGRLCLTLATSLAAAGASLVVPRALRTGVDQTFAVLKGGGFGAEARHALWMSAGLLIAATAIRGLLTMAAGYQGEYLSQRVALDLRLQFFQQLQRLSFGFHDRVHSGDLITRGMLDLEGARVFINNALLQAASLAMLLGFVGVMMVRLDPMLALLALSFVPVASVALARMGFLLRVTWLRVQQLMSQLTLTMEENLQGIRVVRAFAGRAFELGKFDQVSDEVLAFQYKRITLRFRGVAWMQVSYYAAMALLMGYGARQVMAGAMSVGKLAEFLAYMSLLQAPIRQIAMIFNSSARATSSGQRLFEVLDLAPEIADAPGAEPLAPSRGVLRF